MRVAVRPLVAADREAWGLLAHGYKAFYQTVLPDAAYERTWQRLLQRDGIHGLGAWLDDGLVGITHYLFHTGIWSPRACYLEDLFVDPAARGQGVARALIEAVAVEASGAGARRLYWLTHETNVTARALYEQVAKRSGFLEYERELSVPE